MLKVATTVVLGVFSCVSAAGHQCNANGECAVELSSMQEVVLKVFKEMVADPEKSTVRERVDMFEVWQLMEPSHEATQIFYNAWAPIYDVDMIGSNYVNPRSVADDVLAAGFAFDTPILDVGAGTGTGGLKLKELGYTNIDATDGSVEMLELAKKTGAYQNFFPCLVPTDGSPLCDIPEGSYDVVTSSGAFYPFHLQGVHLASIVTAVKVGGTLVISACPHNDVDVGLRPAIHELVDQGVVLLRKEEYIDDWFDGEDGTLWKLERLK